jgi:Zn-dependent protease with chaperone function
MRRRRFLCLGAGAALCGCAAGAVTPIPGLGTEAIAQARDEIADLPPPPRRELAPGEVTRTLDRIERRLNPPAAALCQELGVGRCDWWVEASRSRALNASAHGSGQVTINRGVFEYARSEDEAAFVVGHEMAHQIANHPRNSTVDAQTGGAIGSVLGGLLVVAASIGGAPPTPRQSRRAVESYGQAGASLGALAFSKEQEREADRLSLLLLWRAGYDPDRARGFVLTMARASQRRETWMFDSHPAGPERLAAFDQTLAQLRASNGAIPLRSG